MKTLALDYGAAHTGVAVSDATGTLARPVGIVERAASDAGLERIVALVADHEAELVVVGLPLTLRGERGAQARETEAFVEALRARLQVPVETEDERFTTVLAAADGRPRAGGRARRRPPPCRAGWSARDETRASRFSLSWALVGVGAFAATAWVAGGERRGARGDRHRSTAARPPDDHLPGGVHDPRDGRPGRGGQSHRDPQARRHAAAHAGGLPRAPSIVPSHRRRFRKRHDARLARGLPLPGVVRVHARRRLRASSSHDQLDGLPPALSDRWTSRYATLEEPDAVRRADHRVDDREGDGRRREERRLVAAVIYNRLQNAACRSGSTRRFATASNIPGTESLTKAAPRARTRRTTRG